MNRYINKTEKEGFIVRDISLSGLNIKDAQILLPASVFMIASMFFLPEIDIFLNVGLILLLLNALIFFLSYRYFKNRNNGYKYPIGERERSEILMYEDELKLILGEKTVYNLLNSRSKKEFILTLKTNSHLLESN
jgi:hypothetical protein